MSEKLMFAQLNPFLFVSIGRTDVKKKYFDIVHVVININMRGGGHSVTF